jgi:predicted nucleic acid-binding protein
MRRFLFDTAVFVYALGRPHPYRAPCRAVLEQQAAGALAGEVSVALVQELARQRLRQTGDRTEAAARARDVAVLCRVHDLRADDLPLALQLYEQHPRLDAVDAVFAAVALARRLEVILSPDRGFDGLPGLERVDPADLDAVARLAA